MSNKQLALVNDLMQSGLLPQHIRTPQQAFAIITMGQELGLGPWASLNGINVIRGKPTLSGQAMLGLVRASGELENFELKERTAEKCTIAITRRGQSPVTLTFTYEEAEGLGLANKENYKRQPAVMLQWRCVSALCRLVFPDILGGFCYTPEEINPDIQVDEDGAIVNDYDPELLEAELNPGMAVGQQYDETAREREDALIASFGRGMMQFDEEWTEEDNSNAAQELAIRLGNVIGGTIYTKDLGDTFYQDIGLSRTDVIREARLRFAGAMCGRNLGSFNDMTSPELFALRGIVDYLLRRNALTKSIQRYLGCAVSTNDC